MCSFPGSQIEDPCLQKSWVSGDKLNKRETPFMGFPASLLWKVRRTDWNLE